MNRYLEIRFILRIDLQYAGRTTAIAGQLSQFVHLIHRIIVARSLSVTLEQSSSGVLKLFPAGPHSYDRYFTRAATRG
ncbi:hypothetical protein TNCV_2450201 [Trichonephila clavipes]|nr:hypothetical protein TNCV_2450201 [Trichonephila clavipes]